MSKTQEALKRALEAQIHKAGMNPVMQGECYLMHPEALQKLIEVAIREALAEQPAQQPAQQPICGLDVYLDPNDGLKPKLFPKKPAQPSKPLTDEQIDLFINGRGDEGDDDYVEPTGDGFGLTDADLVRLVRRVEAAHGIKGDA